MTTINAAAAMHVGMRGTIAALTVIVASGLAGCSGGGANIGNLLQGGSAGTETTGTALTAPPVAASRGKIAIAPVIGAPDQIAKQIVTQLGAETAKNKIAIAKTAGEQVDYTLRGYIVAARESTGTKVSYIWDVTNPTGARVHRITGEEVVKGAGAGDPWASVSPQLIQVIAAKTGQQLNTWMPQKQAQPTQQAVPVAQKPLLPPTKQVAGTTATAATKVAAATNTARGARSGLQPTPVATPRSTASTTGSIRKAGPVTALVPQVVGAPGDGSRSLASALRNELLRNGIKPSPPGTPSYRVEGRVKVGAAKNGQQPIRIDWVVKDPKGVNLGTVSQENKIPGGSLNGAWGGTANAAATAATQGILKLLPKRTASR
ncbi:MAG: hypothetical protein ACR2PI_23625 [Hyphomicrobiaceae bacterium]